LIAFLGLLVLAGEFFLRIVEYIRRRALLEGLCFLNLESTLLDLENQKFLWLHYVGSKIFAVFSSDFSKQKTLLSFCWTWPLFEVLVVSRFPLSGHVS